MIVPLMGCEPAPAIDDLVRLGLVMENADATEIFVGEAVGNPFAEGLFSMVSTKGASCNGGYTLPERDKGIAIVRCDDGRTGQFVFVTNGLIATGEGVLGNESFTVTALERKLLDRCGNDFECYRENGGL
jgi:hypothetical protein